MQRRNDTQLSEDAQDQVDAVQKVLKRYKGVCKVSENDTKDILGRMTTMYILGVKDMK